MKIVAISPDHALRAAACDLIKESYALHYNAKIENFPATLIAAVDDENEIYSVAGLRGHREPFFSELYLDEPIEDLISQIAGRPVERSSIVEVSCLAGQTASLSSHFIRKLILQGGAMGYDWAFFTATSRLAKLFSRMRLPLVDFGPAHSTRVPNPEIWGSYYRTDPHVLVFNRELFAPFPAEDLRHHCCAEACLHG
jgi:hypothetical protein